MGKWPGVQRVTSVAGPKGSIRVPIANVTSVDFKKARGKLGSAQGYIGFRLAGSRTSGPANSQHVLGNVNFRDEQRVLFFPQQEADFEAIAKAVQEAIVVPMAAPPPGASGIADELRKLGELKSEALLTEAEFDEQKRRLLGA